MKDKRLGGDTMAPSGLYARLCHAFLVYISVQSILGIFVPLSLHIGQMGVKFDNERS